MKKKNRQNTPRKLRLPEKGEIFGQVVQNLGGGMLLTKCEDDEMRKVKIPGRYRRRMWTRPGDVITLMPRYGLRAKERGDMTHRYLKRDHNKLLKKELIPEEFTQFSSY